MNEVNLEKKAANIRLNALSAIHRAGLSCTGHAMSVVEILVALYYGQLFDRTVINYDPANPGSEKQDYLILSKWQAAVTQYALLADLGFFDQSELDYLGQDGSLLKNFPNMKVPGVSASIATDGFGLSVAVGAALSLKMERRANRVYSIIGDYELQKGQIWEALLLAAHHRLDNLMVFVDNPFVEADLSGGGMMRIDRIQQKFESFGWKVIQVVDGHNFDQILDGIYRGFGVQRVPVCIWCRTVAGKGVGFAERKPGYLNASLSDNEILEIIPKLEMLR